MGTRRWLALVALASMLLLPSLVTAQDATPAAEPATCDGAQRSVEEFLALWYGPDGTPVAKAAARTEVTIQIGLPADEATMSAIDGTIRNVFACFAAGDILRAYAFFTDNLVLHLAPGPDASRAEVEAYLARPAEPDPYASELIAITNVMVLPDGRAGAFIVNKGVGGITTEYGVFEQHGAKWLIDEVIQFRSDEG